MAVSVPEFDLVAKGFLLVSGGVLGNRMYPSRVLVAFKENARAMEIFVALAENQSLKVVRVGDQWFSPSPEKIMALVASGEWPHKSFRSESGSPVIVAGDPTIALIGEVIKAAEREHPGRAFVDVLRAPFMDGVELFVMRAFGLGFFRHERPVFFGVKAPNRDVSSTHLAHLMYAYRSRKVLSKKYAQVVIELDLMIQRIFKLGTATIEDHAQVLAPLTTGVMPYELDEI